KEADDAGYGYPSKLCNRLWVDKAVDGLVAGDDRAEQNDEHDRHAGKVLHPAKPIVEDLGRRSPDKHEGDPQWDPCGGIGYVVDGVGKERDGPRRHDDDQLQGSGDRQEHEGPFDGPDVALRCCNRWIDHAMRVAVIVTVAMIMAMPSMDIGRGSEAKPI